MDRSVFRELCGIDGISGREGAVREYILTRLGQSAAPHEVTVDGIGNVIVRMIGKEPAARRLMLDAHMDEVGFLVTHITDDGFLHFTPVGGIDKQVLYGHRVCIGGQPGVIGGKAIHHCGKEELSIPENDRMVIDIGACDRAQAEKTVSVGDGGTFVGGFTEFGDGFFRSKAVDDRVGCALLLEMAQIQPPRDLWLSFSTQEEVGLRGAAVAARAISPDVAIALDATTAADVAGNDDASSVCKVRHGAVVSFADRATLYDYDLYREIRALADEHGIPTQTKTKVAGGNDAGAIQCSGSGVRMAAVSLPCRYIHSPACVGNWDDVDSMEKLLILLAEGLTR